MGCNTSVRVRAVPVRRSNRACQDGGERDPLRVAIGDEAALPVLIEVTQPIAAPEVFCASPRRSADSRDGNGVEVDAVRRRRGRGADLEDAEVVIPLAVPATAKRERAWNGKDAVGKRERLDLGIRYGIPDQSRTENDLLLDARLVEAAEARVVVGVIAEVEAEVCQRREQPGTVGASAEQARDHEECRLGVESGVRASEGEQHSDRGLRVDAAV